MGGRNNELETIDGKCISCGGFFDLMKLLTLPFFVACGLAILSIARGDTPAAVPSPELKALEAAYQHQLQALNAQYRAKLEAEQKIEVQKGDLAGAVAVREELRALDAPTPAAAVKTEGDVASHLIGTTWGWRSPDESITYSGKGTAKYRSKPGAEAVDDFSWEVLDEAARKIEITRLSNHNKIRIVFDAGYTVASMVFAEGTAAQRSQVNPAAAKGGPAGGSGAVNPFGTLKSGTR